jgi:hypothetical protein
VELVLISPFVREEWDAATPRVRERWRGRARLVRVAAAQPMRAGGAIDVRGSDADDPLRATVALLGATAGANGAGAVRLDRGAPEASDTLWAAAAGHVLVRWPATVPAAWTRQGGADSVGAVMAGDAGARPDGGDALVVAPFVRDAAPPPGRAVAWWVDGQPAATERPVGGGCIRDVAISFPARGDLALRENARRFVRALAAPCGGVRRLALLDDSALVVLRGAGGLLDPGTLREAPGVHGMITTWLLAAAAVLIIAEPFARRAGGAR